MKKNITTIIVLILLTALALYLYRTQGSSTIKKELSDFAVEDTASITKIFLADRSNRTILLERVDEVKWKLNNKYTAKQDAVNNLLEVIKKVSVKAPVPKVAFENVVKQISGSHVKIEIYQGSDTPEKVYFVGHSDRDHTGNYMLLDGSSVPFLTHMEGFRGFLGPRYFTNENDWRSTKIFAYQYGEIKSVQLEHTDIKSYSFKITNLGDDIFSLKSVKDNKEIENYDTLKVMQYLSLFKKVHFESFEETKTEAIIDSVKKAVPMHLITVTEANGNQKNLKTFLKPNKPGAEDELGNPITHDLDRLYALIDDSTFVVIQYYVFDPIFKTIDDFKKGY
ncbi:MAG: hypothetical protein COA57_11085 [Flavobacteriales bacterium]|nr:MAG: hypothetical protein COA57_11085 [Flavobacteriales bacterium]